MTTWQHEIMTVSHHNIMNPVKTSVTNPVMKPVSNQESQLLTTFGLVLKMFYLNMENYPLFFFSLSTWTWNTFPACRGTLVFYLNHVLPPRPSKSYRVVGWGGVVSGPWDFSDSPEAKFNWLWFWIWLDLIGIFELLPNLCQWQLFREGTQQGIFANFTTSFFKPPKLWPGVNLWTFTVLKMIALSWAIWWAQKFL